MRKAILMFSKGLDSLLAGKIIQSQGIEVIPVTYITPFFNWKYSENPDAYHEYCKSQGFEKSILIDLTEEYLKILQKPKYGFGKYANPCIACKILMFTKTKQLLEELNADFIISGEVIGQRPKSQNKWAMDIIKREAGVDDLLVRPLSAKVLPKTLPEKLGWIDREKLFGLQGRDRKFQLELVEKFGIKEFSTPAGGCLLTDPQIGKRILKILSMNKTLNELTSQLSVFGRHFIEEDRWIVLGRNDKENKKIVKLAKGKLPLYTLTEPAPVAAIIEGNADSKVIKDLLVKFSKKAQNKIKSEESVELIPVNEEEFKD
jgi:tRNA U34 2-thiouridine synthase MnmA/TrmU